MSSEVEEPPSTNITLRFEDGRWVARDEDVGVSREGASRSDALAALDAAIEGTEGAINTDDPFWDADPVTAGLPADLSTNVDDYHYDDRSTEDG
jgi:hypothetical protein